LSQSKYCVLADSVTVLYNYVQNLGTNHDKIESSLIGNLANSSEPEKIVNVSNQVAQLSRSESIPLEDPENHVKQNEEEIKSRHEILESTNVRHTTIKLTSTSN
jgi:hypothetical protein